MIRAGLWGIRGATSRYHLAAKAAGVALAAALMVGPTPGALAASSLKTELLPLGLKDNPNFGVRGQVECTPGELRIRLDRVASAENPVLVAVFPPLSRDRLIEPLSVHKLMLDEAGRADLRVHGADAPPCMAGSSVFVLDKAFKLVLVGVLR
jgi:hypothetical protein